MMIIEIEWASTDRTPRQVKLVCYEENKTHIDHTFMVALFGDMSNVD